MFDELEFVVAVNQFFDDAIFFQMRGHREYEIDMEELPEFSILIVRGRP